MCKILKLKIDKLNHALPIPLSDFRVDLSLMKCPYNQTYNLRNLIIAFNWLDLLNVLQSLLTKWKIKREKTLATHVHVFLGFTGFRFPFAYFPSHTASGHELYLLVRKFVNMPSTYGFTVQYISTDGAQSNRDLFKILIPNFDISNPITCSFRNFFLTTKILLFFIMDISHVLQK